MAVDVCHWCSLPREGIDCYVVSCSQQVTSLLTGRPYTAFERLEPDAGKLSRPVVCPAKAGVFSRRQTYQGKSQSPVARRAGGRETNLLKPLDSLICGMGARLQAVAQANAQVAP